MVPKRLANPLCRAILIVLLVSFISVGSTVGEPDYTSMRWVVAAMCGLFLLAAIVISAFYFGHDETEKRPILLGIATFSAACGVGIGFSSEFTFATIIPVLAAAYGGALVCAVSYRPRQARRSQLLGRISAASGIPLMLGAYFSKSVMHFGWYPDIRRLVVVVLILGFTIGLAAIVGRSRHSGTDSPDRTEALVVAGASFGAFIGLVTGLSSEPVVTYVAPASLALFAGSVSCFFAAAGNDGDAEEQRIATVLLGFGALLVVSLLLGTAVRLQLSWNAVLPALFAFATLVTVAGAMALTPALGPGGYPGGATKILGFSFLGAGIGLPVGMSQTPVLHIVLPTALAVFAGLAGYVFITDREHRRRFLVLLAVFGVLALAGGFAGNTLRTNEVTPIFLAIPEHKLEESHPETEITPEAGPSLFASSFAELDDHIALVVFGTEGAHYASAILLQVSHSWSGTVRIEDRVNQYEVLYESVPTFDTPAIAMAESLRIRWPASMGTENLRIFGWNELVERDGKLTVEGDPDEIDISNLQPKGAVYELDYPF